MIDPMSAGLSAMSERLDEITDKPMVNIRYEVAAAELLDVDHPVDELIGKYRRVGGVPACVLVDDRAGDVTRIPQERGGCSCSVPSRSPRRSTPG